MCIRPVDIALLHDWKRGAHVASGKLDDFLISSGLEFEELVAGEGNQLESVVFVLVIYVNKFSVKLVTERAL